MDRAAGMAAATAVVVGVGVGPAPAAPGPVQPAPQLHHWVLPADQSGVEVATLHPHDCYVVQAADGVVYFGAPTPAMVALQRQVATPAAHLVDRVAGHTECTRRGCLETARVAAALAREFASVNRRQARAVGHRPSPADSFYGGAYTDVGSDTRERFRNAPEQRMLFQHLATARRDNCYEAKMPRTLTIHVRDHERHPHRTGVYHGYLYVEHHHPEVAGQTVAD